MTTPERFDPWASIDFDALAGKLQDHMADLIHHVPPGEPQLHGNAFYAEALRRTITAGSSGLESHAQALRTVEMHAGVDRANRCAAERRCAELSAQLATAKGDALADAAESLRTMMNNKNITRPMGKFRIEGWLQAAMSLAGWARHERWITDRQEEKGEGRVS
jgi:hypothetical protein